MVMGTILAAPIGVVGAAVVLLSVIALPQMLASGYNKQLAIGTIASAGTLGILIPPAIMLVVMAEMLNTSAGALFAAATMPGLSAVGPLSRLHHRGRDHQTRLGAEAPRRLRAADACRVLAHDVEGPVPHDLPDGRGARLDLRRLGDRDRKRRRRRARLLRHRVAQRPPEAADGQRCDPRGLPRQRDGVSHLPRRDRLLLRVPHARRRRPDGLDARDASASTPSGRCWRS